MRCFLTIAATAACLPLAGQPYPPSPAIETIEWKLESRIQHGPGSDQWPLTWADDDQIYAGWGDGWGWDKAGPKNSIGVTRISGMPPRLEGEDLWGAGPGAGFGKPEALIAWGGKIYLFWTWGRSKDDQANTATAVSSDRGAHWTLHERKAFPQVPDGFRVRGVAQFGRGYAGARDEYVYVYFGFSRADDLYLARVPKSRILDAAGYEWFAGSAAGQPAWRREFAEKRPVFTDPGGYIWHAGVSYLPGVKRYLLTKPHYPAGADRAAVEGDRKKVAGLGVFDAPEPWGPWTTVYHTDRFVDGLFKFTYFIPGKYVDAESGQLWLAWSGYPEYDNVNFMQGTIRPRGGAREIPFRHVVLDENGPPDLHSKGAGDLNGDGLPDLAVAGTKGGVVWYEAPGWTRHVVAAGGGGWSCDIEVADIDRDGHNDLVLSDWYGNSRLVWFRNPGRGRGEWTPQVISAIRAHDIRAADLNGDGRIDLVTRQQGVPGNRLEIYLQQSPAEWRHQFVACPEGEGLTVADLDRDGDPDLVIGARWYENAAGRWTERVYAPTYTHPAAFPRVADFNGDGRSDIVLVPTEARGSFYRIAWFEAPANPGAGAWTEHEIDPRVETVQHSIGVADMDGDGDADVVTAQMHQGADPDEVKIYLNEDGGKRWRRQVVATTGSHNIRVLDIGNDGDFDIFGANWRDTTRVELWENRSAKP